MKCRMCGSPVDRDMQFCITCGVPLNFAVEKANALSIARKIRNKVLFWSCVVCGLLQIVSMLIVPGGHSMIKANMAAVASRGRDIYVAITSANVEREPLGLPSLWPKTYIVRTNHPGDITSKVFKTSSEYFYELYDGPHVGSSNHDPYVKGFDYSKLAGAGVPANWGDGKLESPNNMWLIAANITEEDSDIIPLLITRNVDVKEIERYINHSGGRAPDDTRIELGKGAYKTPFGKKGFVMVRKGGGTFNNTAKYATLRVLFNSQTLPPRDPSKPPIVYLMP